MEETAAVAAGRPHLVRRLYNWVLHWAETPYGAVALFLLAFAESSFFPIPPDVLLIALTLSMPKKHLRYAAICTVGSVLGGMAGYGIGLGLWEALGAPADPVSLSAVPPISGGAALFRYIPGFTPEVFLKVRGFYADNAALTVFTAAFTPIPYKVITIAAGVCRISFVSFIVFSTLGRAMRFFLVAALLRLFGPPVRRLIEKYFDLLSLLFAILLIGGFLVIRYWDRIAGMFQ